MTRTGAYHQPRVFLWLAVTAVPLLLALLLVLLFAQIASAQSLGGRVLERAPANMPAPKASWQNADGETVRLSDFRGKVVLLNFWATWCGPCVIEMPDLDALAKKYHRSGLEVVAVSLDEEGKDIVTPFYQKYGLNHLDIYLKGHSAAQTYGVRTMPTSYLIDREGMLVGHVPGFARWQTPALEKHIQAALKKGYRPEDIPSFNRRPVRDFTD